MHPVVIVLLIMLIIASVICLILFGIWFKKYKESREAKRIHHGVELLREYVVMMDKAEDLCDPQMAYDAFKIGMKACDLLRCKDTTEAKYYYLNE